MALTECIDFTAALASMTAASISSRIRPMSSSVSSSVSSSGRAGRLRWSNFSSASTKGASWRSTKPRLPILLRESPRHRAWLTCCWGMLDMGSTTSGCSSADSSLMGAPPYAEWTTAGFAPGIGYMASSWKVLWSTGRRLMVRRSGFFCCRPDAFLRQGWLLVWRGLFLRPLYMLLARLSRWTSASPKTKAGLWAATE